MKFKTIYFLFFFALSCFIFTNSSNGPAAIQHKDRTGSPLSDGPCQTCHSSGAFNPTFTIKLLEEGGAEVIHYVAGVSYTLEVELSADTTAKGYGFQVVALTGLDNVNVGTFGDAPDGMQAVTLNERKYIEHSAISSTGKFSIEWTAPEMGRDTAKFFAAVVAANANGSTGGDGSVFGQAIFAEAVTSIFDRSLAVDIQIMPNPITNNLHLEINTNESKNVHLNLFNSIGQLVKKEPIAIVPGINIFDYDLHHLPKGQYFLQLDEKGRTATKKLLKL
jgi:hypothetical protein